ncbi:MAG: type 4a pilus biogenesis protein PilO [Phycisphaerales bacterium]|nr:MAG: type 4a pilus biogenesis protein PilO [Phycisphaerales bacterium]
MLVQNLAKLERSKRKAASASLILIAAFAMYNRMVTPHAANLSTAKAYESAVDNLAKENRIIASKVEIKRKELQQLREHSVQILDTLFTSDQAREFFSDIEVISEQIGCAVRAVNFVGNDQESEHEHLGIRTRSAELNVVGLYANIARLIRRLQARSQKVCLDSVKLQAIDYNSDKVGCSLTITVFEIVDKDTS